MNGSESALKRRIIVMLGLAALCAFVSGCTDESPSAPPTELSKVVSAESSGEISSGSKDESTEESFAESFVSKESSSEKSAVSSPESKAESSVQSVTETSSAVSSEPPLYTWDKRKGKLVEIKFKRTGETESDYFMTDDEEMLQKLTEALDGIVITGESDKRYSDSGIILLYTQENGTGRLDFEHGGLVSDNVRYETDGYDKLASVLDEIEKAYPEWSKKYDEWIHRMSVVENRVQEITTSTEYENADTEKKRELVMPVLRELEKEGYIKEGSIYDDGESITYSTIDGVLSGIMLKGFDPMMN